METIAGRQKKIWAKKDPRNRKLLKPETSWNSQRKIREAGTRRLPENQYMPRKEDGKVLKN